jgi:hypothetical protein
MDGIRSTSVLLLVQEKIDKQKIGTFGDCPWSSFVFLLSKVLGVRAENFVLKLTEFASIVILNLWTQVYVYWVDMLILFSAFGFNTIARMSVKVSEIFI